MNPRDRLSATIEEIIERRTDGGGGAGLATDEIMRLFGSAMVLEATTQWHELAEWLKEVPSGTNVRTQDVLDKMSQLDPEVPADDEDIRPRKTPMCASGPADDEDKWVKRHRAHLNQQAPDDDPINQYEDYELVKDPGPVNMVAPTPEIYDHAHAFMSAVFGEDGYTPDSIGQLVDVFVPCLRIMCNQESHPWPTDGALWRQGGFMPVMIFLRAKFMRYWYRTWIQGKRHDDSGYDGINFWAFSLRAEPDNQWGELGEPAPLRAEQ